MELIFISTGDFGGSVEAASQLLNIDLEKYNFAVFTGDLIAMKELRKIGEATARGQYIDTEIDYSDLRKRLAEINQVFRQLMSRTKLYGILGNSDLRKTFISLVPKIEMESVHNRVVQIGEYSLIGYEGRPMNIDEIRRPNEIEQAGIFPGRTYLERSRECNAWNEEKAYEDLSKILQAVNPRRSILVTHYPPYGILDRVEKNNIPWAIASYGDKARSGNIGSEAFQKITKRFGVLLHVFSHVHESKGIERIGNTTYVNIGSLEENRDVCEIELNEEVKINFLKLSAYGS